MTDIVFLKILDMSLAGSFVILAVLAARLVFRRAPAAVSYALWALVLVRLLLPFSITAPFSAMPQTPSAAENYSLADEDISVLDAADAAYRAVGDALNGGLGIQHVRSSGDSLDGADYVTTTWTDVWKLFLGYVWLFGALVLAAYSAVRYMLLRRQLREAVVLEGNILLADRIGSPFVLGIFRPRIFLPSSLSEAERTYIILHEQHHIRRGDHVIKALSFLALCLHWFNPLVWLAFALSGRDMEMSCDEAVIRSLGDELRADYSASLLSLATGRRIIAGTPLAFGEGDTGKRIKNLSTLRRPVLWVSVAAVLVGVLLALVLLTDPQRSVQDLSFLNYENAVALAGQSNSVNVIYCPEEGQGGADIQIGEAHGRALAAFLDNADWKQIREPADSPPSPGSIEFCIEDDYRITVWKTRRLVRVSFGEDTRWYRAGSGDYAAAVELALPPGSIPAESDPQAAYTLEEAIEKAVLAQNYSEHNAGCICVESHRILANEGNEDGSAVTVFALVLYRAYDPLSIYDRGMNIVSASYIPSALSFEKDELGAYRLTEYWIPRDGEDYSADIRQKFPGLAALAALGQDSYYDELDADCSEKAMALWPEYLPALRTPLTKEQLNEVNEYFHPLVYDKQGSIIGASVTSCFLTSYYDDVRELELERFLSCFSDEGLVEEDEEFAALKAHPDWSWGDIALEDMPVPIHRFSRRVVDLCLNEYAGITTAELKGIQTGSELIYLEEYDSFYNFTSDFAAAAFEWDRGELEGDTLRLYSELSDACAVLTLRREDSRWLISSFVYGQL